jgi:hypothetical protein
VKHRIYDSVHIAQPTATHIRPRRTLGHGWSQASPNAALKDEYVIHHHQTQTCPARLFQIFFSQEAAEVIVACDGAVDRAAEDHLVKGLGTTRPFKGLTTMRLFRASVLLNWATSPTTLLLNTLYGRGQVLIVGDFPS